uniref:Putative peptidoglycan synthetase n=1 Tax=Nephroselmis pyriformis TaxID=156128 RepID=A0A8A2H8E4_9CHLO|nr:putative peptidoglycan synthetase [Nephroselmis pyriformis]QSV37240.1 putative peptidoglycan synthetase [Nephroselmis pyriformis]
MPLPGFSPRNLPGGTLLFEGVSRLTPSIRLVLAGVFGVLAIRLLGLQGRKHLELKLLAEAQQISSLQAIQPRRPILDTNQNILALDIPANDLYVHPCLFRLPPEQVATLLAPILDLPDTYILKRFQESPTGIRLCDQLTTQQSLQIQRLWLDGLELLHHPRRLYPHRGSMANVLGYVDMEQQGQAGLEMTHQEDLAQESYSLSCWTDGRGQFLGKHFTDSILFQDEASLQLTLDLNLQESVAYQVECALQKFQAKRISAIVLEAHTGAIRCMVSAPTYDPNHYQRFPVERFRTWATTDILEPGSTFKPINLAIALETEAIATTDRIEDRGRIKIAGEDILNVGVSPEAAPGPTHYLTPAEILKRSSNVGMVQMMQRLPPSLYHDWFRRLGLGVPIGLTEDFPHPSVDSVIKPRDEFCNHPIEPAAASFGQGLAMTPLKLLQLTATLANGGYLVIPHVTAGLLPTIDQKEPGSLAGSQDYSQALYFGHLPIPSQELGWTNCEALPNHARPRQRVFSPQTTRAVLNMLEEVVLDPQATGSRCFLPGYGIGGKTGTAQKASQKGGYQEGAVVTSFVGIYPIHAPKFVTLVMIDEPQGPYSFASNTAADLTQRILAEIIHLTQAPPMYPRVNLLEREEP